MAITLQRNGRHRRDGHQPSRSRRHHPACAATPASASNEPRMSTGSNATNTRTDGASVSTTTRARAAAAAHRRPSVPLLRRAHARDLCDRRSRRDHRGHRTSAAVDARERTDGARDPPPRAPERHNHAVCLSGPSAAREATVNRPNAEVRLLHHRPTEQGPRAPRQRPAYRVQTRESCVAGSPCSPVCATVCPSYPAPVLCFSYTHSHTHTHTRHSHSSCFATPTRCR